MFALVAVMVAAFSTGLVERIRQTLKPVDEGAVSIQQRITQIVRDSQGRISRGELELRCFSERPFVVSVERFHYLEARENTEMPTDFLLRVDAVPQSFGHSFRAIVTFTYTGDGVSIVDENDRSARHHFAMEKVPQQTTLTMLPINDVLVWGGFAITCLTVERKFGLGVNEVVERDLFVIVILVGDEKQEK